jgi:hypothetical protein
MYFGMFWLSSQAHRNPLRQAGPKLLRLCLLGRRSCVVDLMSLDPRTQSRNDAMPPALARVKSYSAGIDVASSPPFDGVRQAWAPAHADLATPTNDRVTSR